MRKGNREVIEGEHAVEGFEELDLGEQIINGLVQGPIPVRLTNM